MIKKVFLALAFANGFITYKAQAFNWQELIWGPNPAIKTRIEETKAIVEKKDIKLFQSFLEKHKNEDSALAKITLDTAYLHAIAKGSKQLALVALERGADKNAQDDFGDTALHHAVFRAITTHNTELIQFLIEQEVAYKKNNVGQTPAMIADGCIKIFYVESGKEFIIQEKVKEEILVQLHKYVVETVDKTAQKNANLEQQKLLEARLKAQILSLDITREQAQQKLSSVQKDYEAMARQAGDLSQQRKQIAREILIYQSETQKLNSLKAEKQKLQEQLDKTDIAMAEQRKKNDENRIIIEQELKELRSRIEQKNRERIKLQQEEQAVKQQESSLQRAKAGHENHTHK